MSRAKLPLLSLFALLFILGACQSEGKIEGEVFVVTEGRENIEMGLVEVKAIKASSLEEHLKERHSQSKGEVKSLAREAKSLLDSVSVAQQLYEKKKAEYEEAQSEYEETVAMYRATLRSFNSSPQASAGDRVAVALEKNIKLRVKPNFSSAMVGYMSGGEMGTVLSVREKKVNTFYEIRTKDGNTGWTGYTGKMVEPKEKVIYLKNKSKKVSNKRKEEYKETENEIEVISKVYNRVLDSMSKYRKQGHYYENMPQAAESDETGSDGNYELTVEAGVPYYLVATANRSVGGGEEHYYWMVKTTVESGETKEVNLSNNNLGGVADRKYALNERTVSKVKRVWESAVSLAKEGEQELDWEKLIYRTAFPQDSSDVPIPDDLNVPEEKLVGDR